MSLIYILQDVYNDLILGRRDKLMFQSHILVYFESSVQG